MLTHDRPMGRWNRPRRARGDVVATPSRRATADPAPGHGDGARGLGVACIVLGLVWAFGPWLSAPFLPSDGGGGGEGFVVVVLVGVVVGVPSAAFGLVVTADPAYARPGQVVAAALLTSVLAVVALVVALSALV